MKLIIHCRLTDNISLLPVVLANLPEQIKEAEGLAMYCYKSGVTVSFITRKTGTTTVYINEPKDNQ